MVDRIDDFLTYLVENKNKSTDTARNYRRHLAKLFHYLLEIQREAAEVTTMELEAYTGPVLHKEGLGPHGRSTAISAIKGFYKYCSKRGLIASNPARDLEHPKFGRKLPEMLSLEEIEKMMYGPDLGTLKGLRDAAIMAFIFGTGCRVSGLTSLNEDQLAYAGQENPPRRYVTLREKGKKERRLPLNRKVELFLHAYLNHPEMKAIDRAVGQTNVVFINLKNTRIERVHWRGEARRISEDSVIDIFKKYGRAAGIPDKRLHPHAGRHTVATMQYEAEMTPEDRMAWMGHESMETMKLYPLLSDIKLLRGAEAANPLSNIQTPFDEIFKRLFVPGKGNKNV